MNRCGYCRRWIWPWQRYGFFRAPERTHRWHSACKRLLDDLLASGRPIRFQR